jgi:gamma-glutamyltranspeptidase/glutathione hydrolase
VALAYDERTRFSSLLDPAVRRARSVGAAHRAAVLERIRAAGPRALGDPNIAGPLVAIGGPPEGGVLTRQDLEATPMVDHAAVEVPVADGALTARASWVGSEAYQREAVTRAICAMDSTGLAAALCYSEPRDGVPVPELELTLLPSAVPVMRGVERLAPGTSLPAPAPIRITQREGDPCEVVASLGDTVGLRRDPRTRTVTQLS